MKFFSFYQYRRWFYGFSTLILLIGMVFLCIKGVRLDIQFTGGAILKYDCEGQADIESIADEASRILGRTVSAQNTTDLTTQQSRVVLNIAGEYGMSAQEQLDLDAALVAAFPDAQLVPAEASLVEPFFGKKFLTRAILAVTLALTLILIYEWITFRKIGGLFAGLTALTALAHDLLLVFFTCVVVGIPIGDSFVAAALSIIGYSINDTIVIFDRIRENKRLYPKEDVQTIADLSVRQSMMRCINTNIAVTIAVLMICFLAGHASLDSVLSFALPMAIGSISGCYSTLCLCGPLWVTMHKRTKLGRISESKG